MKRVAASLFAASLYLYPASFRDEYGREMRRVFADGLRNSFGVLDAVLFWFKAMAGVLAEAPKEHFRLMLSDLKYALRTLRNVPGFTAAALITLALGIGANTAIFSVVETLLLRQLPYQDPDRIVMVWVKNPEQGFDHDITSYPRLEDWRAQSRTIAGFSAYSSSSRVLSGSEAPEQVLGGTVSANFFDVMGATPVIGSTFARGDDDFGRERKVVLSHGLWVRRFGGSPRIVGQTITMDGQMYTVIGVMPSTFRYPTRETDFWEPLSASPDRRRERGMFWLHTVARLKPGVTLAQAQEEMDAISRRLAKQYVLDKNLGVDLVRLKDELTADTRPALFVLTVAVALVLLVACANVAGMLIARASDRRLEIALRAALGAGRGRVIRQLLTEALLLFVVGGVLGLAMAAAAIRAIVRLAPPTLVQIREVQINWTVAGYAVGIAALTGLVFGSAPAIQAARRDQANAISRGSSRIGGDKGAGWVRAGLLAAEVAFAFVLLTGAGLLLRSFTQMQSADPGFDATNVVAARVTLPRAKYDKPESGTAFFNAVVERLHATPDVESVAGVTSLFLGRLPNSAGFQIEGRAQEIDTPLTYDAITPDFFRTLKVPLLRGRYFTAADTEKAGQVTIINETTARKYWGEENPVGRRIRFGSGADNGSPWMTIVGVVRDTKRAGIDMPVFTESYQPLTQAPTLNLSLVVRTKTESPAAAAAAIRAAVREVDRQQPVATVASLQSMLDDTIAARRFNTLLVTAFAAAALMLAAVGVYGLLAYVIARQHHEIGIRIALGASAGRIVRAVGGRAMAAAGAGAIGGIALSVAASRAIAGMLFGVKTIDPVTYVVAALLLAGVVTAAAVFPMKRALKVDPAVSLRAE